MNTTLLFMLFQLWGLLSLATIGCMTLAMVVSERS
jgi:hypothetical protein